MRGFSAWNLQTWIVVPGGKFLRMASIFFFFFSKSIHKTGPSNFLQLQSLHHIAHFIGLLTAYKIRVMPLVDFSGVAWPVSWPSAAMPCSAAESTGPRQQVWEAWGHPAGRRRPQSSRRVRRHLAGNGGQQRGAWRTSEVSRAIQTVHRQQRLAGARNSFGRGSATGVT